MKKFELIMGISLLITTTILVVMFPFFIEYSKTNLVLMCILSSVGYITSYLYIDSYLARHEMHYYLKGYDDGLKDATTDVINAFKKQY